MKRCFCLVAGSLWLAASAGAGVVYDVVTTMERPRTKEKVSGRICVEGDFYRAEIERDGSKMVVISRDADHTAAILDPAKKTWSNRSRVAAGSDVRSAALFLWPAPGAKVKGRPAVTHRLGESRTIAGETAVEHVIEASFRVESHISKTPLRGTLHLTARIWVTEALPKLPMEHRGLRTGYKSVDGELEKAESNIQGMVLRHELEVTRAFEGGPPSVEKTTTVISNLQRTTFSDVYFTVPEGFRYTGPRAPGN